MANNPATMTVEETARLLGMKPQTLRAGIEQKAFPWASVITGKRNRYVIFRARFEKETGIKTGGTK